MTMSEERRGSTFRRQVNGLAMRDGEFQESKMFATIGKVLCIWLIWKHTDSLIMHFDALFVLLLFLIAPELVKKFLTMRYGGGDAPAPRQQKPQEPS